MRYLANVGQIAPQPFALHTPERLIVDPIYGSENERVIAHAALCEQGLVGCECASVEVEDASDDVSNSFGV